ncbi:phage antirepressor [Lentibacillus salicampi]|uniref:Phage antirepressor Ant n=1 Tax=Lentibacillus salicampi TaxID=175306 RepID=A0A4Y9AFI2_9BACI|nr:phage antirepressor [Lentibacillus salicampi]TFJ93151.1 phage antirepressor Ant [Lentibacillus salicampi]
MNQLTKMFDGQNLTILENEGEPKFLLKDVCSILEIGNPSQVKTRLEDGVISNEVIQDRLGRQQKATFINEDGLYDVILDSRKKEAKQFRKWITSEVLPSIRKHGAYATPNTIENVMNDPDFGIQLLTNLKQEREERAKLEQQRRLDEPFTTFGKVVSNSTAAINVGAFAKMMYDEYGIKLGRNKMFEWLRDNEFLIKSGREKNQPKQSYLEQGLFDTSVTVIAHKTKGNVQHVTTLITGKGQVKLSKLLTDEFGVTA